MEYEYYDPMQKSPGFTIPHVKKTLLIGAVGFVVLAIGFLLSVLMSPKNTTDQVATSAVSQITPIQAKPTEAKKAPTVSFGTYTNNAQSVVVPQGLISYGIKNNFSVTEVMQFAQKFGLENQSGAGEIVNAYAFTNAQSMGIMAFNKTSGAFYYQSYGTKIPSGYTNGQSAHVTAEQILTDVGLFDDTISCPVTYGQKGAPEGTTFVECHRDWQKIGLPVVNLVGVVNLAETEKIGSLTIGKTNGLTPPDSTIMNVNTGENGKTRPNDFNTITIAVRKDGSIFSISSSLRMLSEKKTLSAADVISSQEAIKQLQLHKAQFSLTIPAGSGSVDFAKVYPGNVATAKLATIEEISLVYPDKFADISLSSYDPTYLIRGTAKLTSGYSVRFVQAIPARKDQLALLRPQIVQQVAGVATHIAQNSPINIGTFDPSVVSPTPTPTPTILPTDIPTVPPTPTVIPTVPVPTPDPVNTCGGTQDQTISIDGGNIVLTSAGFGYHAINLVSTKDNIDMETVRQKLYEAIANEYAVRVAKWVQQNPSLANEVPLIQVVNGQSSCGVANPSISLPDVPVLPTCSMTLEDSSVAYSYNFAAANAITASAADQIKQVGVAALAARATIFPYNYGHFSGMLLQYDGTGGHGSNAIGPCYVSGFSPVIFFYPEEEGMVTLTSGAPITYADPKVTENKWSGFLSKDGAIEVNGNKRESLYYEYNPENILLDTSRNGYVVSSSTIFSFIESTLAKELSLNKKETDALVGEVSTALVGSQNAPYLKVTLATQNELDKKLPLTIDPQPQHLYRLHLLLTPLYQKEFIAPLVLTPILHDRFTVVELGARLQ